MCVYICRIVLDSIGVGCFGLTSPQVFRRGLPCMIFSVRFNEEKLPRDCFKFLVIW